MDVKSPLGSHVVLFLITAHIDAQDEPVTLFRKRRSHIMTGNDMQITDLTGIPHEPTGPTVVEKI